MPGNAILQQIDVPIERLLADFRWQRIDFVDALSTCDADADPDERGMVLMPSPLQHAHGVHKAPVSADFEDFPGQLCQLLVLRLPFCAGFQLVDNISVISFILYAVSFSAAENQLD